MNNKAAFLLIRAGTVLVLLSFLLFLVLMCRQDQLRRNHMYKFIFSGLFAISAGMAAQADDVQFTLLEKGASYEMDEAGELNLARIEFVSETILSKDGAIVDGTIKRVGSAEPIFELKGSDSFYNRYANSYGDFAALDAAHPNTGYVVNIRGRTSDITD